MSRVCAFAALFAAAASAAPAHVHLALSSDTTRMFVQWASDSLPAAPVVQWGPTPALGRSAAGGAWSWADSSTRTVRFESNATMTGLTPGQQVFYRVGDAATGFSPVKSFNATRSRAQFSTAAPQVVAWIGDLGVANAQSLPYLAAEAATG